jgi:hypothetical protein
MVDPPLDCEVLEKPCTVLLMEDRAIYEDSWIDSFQVAIPRTYGMSFASITFREECEFDEMLEELKSDLNTINDAVLVTRGPLSSWCAQFYLESFPLQGLAMVDPVVLDNIVGDEWAITPRLQECGGPDVPSRELNQWKRIFQGAQLRKLKLEPNAVPMLVVYSLNDQACRRNAMEVAKRHSDDEGMFGDVPVKGLFQNKNTNEVISEIDSWIDSIL